MVELSSKYDESGTQSSFSDSLPFAKDQLEQLFKLFDSRVEKSNPSYSLAQTGISSFANVENSISNSSWSLDSGATDHMTGSLFLSMHLAQRTRKLKLPMFLLLLLLGKEPILFLLS